MIIKVCDQCKLRDICKYKEAVEEQCSVLNPQIIYSDHVIAAISCDYVLDDAQKEMLKNDKRKRFICKMASQGGKND